MTSDRPSRWDTAIGRRLLEHQERDKHGLTHRVDGLPIAATVEEVHELLDTVATRVMWLDATPKSTAVRGLLFAGHPIVDEHGNPFVPIVMCLG